MPTQRKPVASIAPERTAFAATCRPRKASRLCRIETRRLSLGAVRRQRGWNGPWATLAEV